jgi:hypothetical protein
MPEERRLAVALRDHPPVLLEAGEQILDKDKLELLRLERSPLSSTLSRAYRGSGRR